MLSKGSGSPRDGPLGLVMLLQIELCRCSLLDAAERWCCWRARAMAASV